ncbi:hypothetical protein M231_06537 [Tremella mesenterica]|uniref:Uncharacterized protein n=1 Tax=Tremella mesenterica TaxID=5217 RepID=A0A4Q1BGA2_TREME|nr:uncharacterized protein TREMEDRAFT_72829 [Tremella mesenterica DSM 1558]EIW72637.1 hypothetical protein TREMEDRAFT_72829 [Tremella mesenterica DSM 1558]RXK36193.1 hypothetical protein M231_06537 [Tremella mesenterica]
MSTSTYQPTIMPLPAPRAREGARSSRRRGGSAQPVLLGGGVGNLGNISSSQTQIHSQSPFLSGPTSFLPRGRSPSPGPNMSNLSDMTSPTSPLFSIPPMPAVPKQRSVTAPTAIPPHSKGRSISSLSTADSTSSHTLKTPHSKVGHHRPPVVIASSSGSFDTHTTSPTSSIPLALTEVKHMTEQRSPTLQTKRVESRKREPILPPAMTQAPLPPVPSSIYTVETKASSPPRPIKAPHRARLPPAPIKTDNKQNRLSQDWVQIISPSEETVNNLPIPSSQSIPPQRPMRLPQATMVPMKGDIRSPKRPNFDRAHSEPLSPTSSKRAVTQPYGRKSMDHLRSTSPSPMPSRQRQSSLSTPASTVLQAGARQSMFEVEPAPPPRPSLQTRRSHDLLRTSTDALRLSKKEIKAMQKEQQRALGVAGTMPLQQEERKSSGLSLKKSTGALKALFARGASGKKDRSETPPVPILNNYPGTGVNRPSMADDLPRPPFGRSRTPNSFSSSTPPLGSTLPQMQGRSSLSVERTMHTGQPMQRAASVSANTIMSSGSPPRRLPPPNRDLPALPPVSPLLPPEVKEAKVHNTPSTSTSSQLGKSNIGAPVKLGDALPTSSLPYLSQLTPSTPSTGQTDLKLLNVALSSSSSPTSPPRQDYDISPIAPSRTFHLLQLPDFGSSLNLAFDKIGTSPSTPRRSPQRSPRKSKDDMFNVPYYSPSRSLSTRITPKPSPTGLTRTRSERRRSRSFDGLSSGANRDLWRVLESNDFLSSPVGKAFASRTPSPMNNAGLEVDESTPVAPTRHVTKPSISSDRSAILSSDHATPSDTSMSSHETPSPSPPRTPESRTATVLGYVDYKAPLTPTRKVFIRDDRLGSFESKQMLLEAAPIILPAPKVEEVKEVKIDMLKSEREKVGIVEPPRRTRTLTTPSKIIVPDSNITLRSLARDLERLLYVFRHHSQTSSPTDRANLVRNELLGHMSELEKRPIVPGDAGVAAVREVGFAWIDAFMLELQVEQPANERGACLEGLAAMIESPCLSEEALSGSSSHKDKFTATMIRVMNFVMAKLGAKGVFHNTLLFCGRFLAFAFFRIPHVGEQLITVLQLPRGAIMRLTREALIETRPIDFAQPSYPSFLRPLCYDNAQAYAARLSALAPSFSTSAESEAFLFRPGNWLRRWQSDDSELFYAFFRAYHRRLAHYLGPSIEHYQARNQPIPSGVLFRAPGYAHLAAVLAKKCHSYILGAVNAVTTSSTTSNFDISEGAAFRSSQKPPVLETANRRLVETLGTLAHMQVLVPTSRGTAEVDGDQLWGNMVNLWTRNLITKTSLYRPQAVFSLFDLLDGIVDAPFDSGKPSVLDVSYLIYLFGLILTQGDHALTLVKVIAFIFTHWEAMTLRPEDRRALCQNLLLEKKMFERLVLFWSHSVRSYLMRLVVFRLGHFHTTKEDDQSNEVEVDSVALLQTRLAWMRKWHDKYESEINSSFEAATSDPPHTPVEGSFPRSKSTITMVQSPHAGGSQKAERLLGLGLGMDDEGKQMGLGGKASNWISKKFGKTKKRKDSGLSPSPIPGERDSLTPSNMRSLSPNPQSLGSSSNLGTSPIIPPLPRLGSPLPMPDSPDSDRLPSPSHRKPPPPTILTTSPPKPSSSTSSMTSMTNPTTASTSVSNSNTSSSLFSFEFELPTASPRSDTFDPAPQPPSPNRNRTSLPPSPSKSSSPRVSARLSKRTSMLPTNTAQALEAILQNGQLGVIRKVQEEDRGYDRKFQPYAVRMFQEFENAQKEYEEWWAEGGIGRADGVPPRLTVAWPFHENED